LVSARNLHNIDYTLYTGLGHRKIQAWEGFILG